MANEKLEKASPELAREIGLLFDGDIKMGDISLRSDATCGVGCESSCLAACTSGGLWGKAAEK